MRRRGFLGHSLERFSAAAVAGRQAAVWRQPIAWLSSHVLARLPIDDEAVPPQPVRPDASGARLVDDEVLEEVAGGLLFVSECGTIVFANAGARDLLGRDLVGRPLAEVLPDLALGTDSSQGQLAFRAKGHEICIGYRCIPRRLDCSGAETAIVFRDVSELARMRAEAQQLQSLSEIGKMSAIVAHEIRNPLSGLMLTLQSIEARAQLAGLRDPIKLMEREVERLNRLLTGFFDFVRQRPPRRRWTSLEELVHLAHLGAGRRLEGISIETRLEGPHEVYVDPDQMQQVLLNLLINAADAIHGREGGRVVVRAAVEAARLELSVDDDGCGIPPEHLQNVLEAFYTTKKGGTGLGLSICSRIVHAHGGTIAVHSALGRGTSVVIALPLDCQIASCAGTRS